MHVISRKKLKEAVARHGDLEGPLDAWFRIAKKDLWRRLADVRKTSSTADALPPGRLVTQFRALPLVGQAQKVLGVRYAPTFIAEAYITGTAWHWALRREHRDSTTQRCASCIATSSAMGSSWWCVVTVLRERPPSRAPLSSLAH